MICVVLHAQSLADKKKNVTDEDVLALVSDEVHQPEKLWDLLGLQVRMLASLCSKNCAEQGLLISRSNFVMQRTNVHAFRCGHDESLNCQEPFLPMPSHRLLCCY